MRQARSRSLAGSVGGPRGGVYQQGADAQVRPAHGRVVEDVVELGLAVEQVGEHGFARLAEVLGDPVEELRVADLVLDLGAQGELPLERGGAQDPFPLWTHANQLGVGVHLDEPADGPPVVVWLPRAHLDLAPGSDVAVEGLGALGVVGLHWLPPAVAVVVPLMLPRPSPSRNRSAYCLAMTSGPSGPSGRYQWARAFMADSRKMAATLASSWASSPLAMPSAITLVKRSS